MSRPRIQKRSKREKLKPQEESSMKSSEKSDNAGITKTPNAGIFPNRTYYCDENFSERNENLFMVTTPINKETKKDVFEIDPPSLEIHGGWMYPEKKYESLPGQVSDDEEEESGENESSDANNDKKIGIKSRNMKLNQRRPCCCCCLQCRMMFCACPFIQQQLRFMRQNTIPYELMDGRQQYQKPGNPGNDRDPKRNQSPDEQNQRYQSRMRQNKDCDAEFRCARDMDLASVRVNKATEGFSNAIKSKKSEADESKRKYKRSKKSKRE